MINEKHGQRTHSTKMGADKLFKNTPNAPKFICPNCLPKPKSLGHRCKKASLGVRSPWLCVYERPEGKIACKMELFRGGFSFSLSKTDCTYSILLLWIWETDRKVETQLSLRTQPFIFHFFQRHKVKSSFFWHFKRCFVWPTSDY